MKTRAGITLIEVLVAIFIMGVGLLAILVLFPVAALNMARAIRDDRAAQCGQQAAAIANAWDLRHDPNVVAEFDKVPAGGYATPRPDTPSYPVFIDPFGATLGAGPIGANGVSPRTPGLPRVAPSTLPGNAAERWCTLLDDINFNPNGTPVSVAPGVTVERYGYYTWAYLARRPQHGNRSLVDLTVLVYRSRNVSVASSERAFQFAPAAPASETLTLSPITAGAEPELRPLGYILDTTYLPTTGTVAGHVYQVTEIQKNTGSWTIRVEPPLRNAVENIVTLEGVIAAFEKGTGWRP